MDNIKGCLIVIFNHLSDLRESRGRSVTLKELILNGVRECHIPLTRAILAHFATQVDALTLVVSPRSLGSFRWAALDIVLSALYLNKHMPPQSKLTLSPASLDISTVISRFGGSQSAALKSLLPLVTSLKEGCCVISSKRR